jgi:hypothetical protein
LPAGEVSLAAAVGAATAGFLGGFFW